MFKKKLLALSLVVALSFTACGKKAETTPETTPTIEAEDDTTKEDVAEDDATEEDATKEDVVEDDATEEDVVEDDTTDDDASDDTMVDTGAVESNETLDEIHEEILEKFGENYVATMAYDATTIAELFGVQADWYDAAIAEGPLMSVHVDKFIAIKASEGNLENVQKALTAYRDALLADTMQYPSNLLKIQGSVVETVGDYVFLVMLGHVDDMAFDNEEDVIAEYTKINNEVIDIAKGEIEE